jgi:ribosomal protein L11 methylase PrmA
VTATGTNAGSFRDPAGRVHIVGRRVFRTVSHKAVADFESVADAGLHTRLIAKGRLVSHRRLGAEEAAGVGLAAPVVLEHPRLPFVSWPYEWSFPALKAAALLHLDVHLDALADGFTLSDATAYNVQFRGPAPVFIDTLSFRPYRDGEYWLGHRQFCDQFLNPLLLDSLLGVSHVPWYRGSLEGVSTTDLAALLGMRHWLSWNVAVHVLLQARFQRAATRKGAVKISVARKLPREGFLSMLQGLRAWIGGLEPGGSRRTVWSDYTNEASYSPSEGHAKRTFVGDFVRRFRPETVWDMGCNTGDYSVAALEAGARRAIGFDFDRAAAGRAFERARREGLDFQPLVLDAANPTPSQGWAQQERSGLLERADADAILALALVHHLSISRNVPLERVVGWIVELAPAGVIEFVPKSDPMVQELLRLREDIFDRYDEQHFFEALRERAEIVETTRVSASGRILVAFRRR